MLYKHLTGASAVNAGYTSPTNSTIKRARIVINTGFTGTLTVSDESGTSGSPVIGVITNPAAGQTYEYWGINTGICVTPSASGMDVTVCLDLSRPGVA